jgi:hypothetical protein
VRADPLVRPASGENRPGRADATFTFRAETSWQESTHSVARIARFSQAGAEDRSRAAPFVVEGDGPPVLIGRHNGPNAVELVLAFNSYREDGPIGGAGPPLDVA